MQFPVGGEVCEKGGVQSLERLFSYPGRGPECQGSGSRHLGGDPKEPPSHGGEGYAGVPRRGYIIAVLSPVIMARPRPKLSYPPR